MIARLTPGGQHADDAPGHRRACSGASAGPAVVTGPPAAMVQWQSVRAGGAAELSRR
jgi:hypothetical protein